MVRNVPKDALQNINIRIIVGNLVICLIEPRDIVLCCVVFPYFDKSNPVTIAIATAYIENWNKILYVTSRSSKRNVPINGPIIKTPTINPMNLAIDLTLC